MFKLLDAFPLLLLVVLVYGVFVVITGSQSVPGVLDSTLFGFNIISGDRLTFDVGDLFILFAFLLLFVEVLKATATGNIAVMNHGLSAGVLVLCIILFLVVKGFGNATFLLIGLTTLFDVIAGFIITTIAARRDFGVGGH